MEGFVPKCPVKENGDAGFRFVNRRSRPAAEKKRRKHAGIILQTNVYINV